MLSALLQKLSTRRTPRSQTPRPQPRARLTLETLEDRVVPSGSPLAADAERSLTTPTGAWVYTGVDAAFLGQRITADNARITDLEVDSTAPYKFTATLVKNTGDYAKGWWWFYDLTGSQLAAKLSQLQARILDLETYSVGSAQRYAAVLVPNTGAAAKTWWYYTNISQATLASKLERERPEPEQGRLQASYDELREWALDLERQLKEITATRTWRLATRYWRSREALKRALPRRGGS